MAERSIRSLGFEEDFYVHLEDGAPVSVETDINSNIEVPISQSETWLKISSGHTQTLDKTDRPILYALIRHLQLRTPHFQATRNQLGRMSVDPLNTMPFIDEEREYYSFINANSEEAKAILNKNIVAPLWSQEDFYNCLITVLRSPIALRSSTTPVMSLPVPHHPELILPLPGMTPFQLTLTVNPTTIITLTNGEFNGGFINQSIDREVAMAFNRHYVGHFSHFDSIRHLISDRNSLIEDMTWAPYQVLKDTSQKIIFIKQS